MSKTRTDKSSDEPINTDVSSSDEPLLLPIKECRRRLGDIGNSFFYKEVAAGRFKLLKVGRRSFGTPAECKRYVAALQEVAS